MRRGFTCRHCRINKKNSKNIFLCCKMKNERFRETWRVSGWRSEREGTLSCASCPGSCDFFCYRALSCAVEETVRAGAQQENSSASGNLSGSLWVYEDYGISACSVRAPSCCWAYEKRRRRMTRRRKSQMRSWMRRMRMTRMRCWSSGISAGPSAASAPPLPRLEMGWRPFQFLRRPRQLVKVFWVWNYPRTVKTDSSMVCSASRRRPCVRLVRRARSLGPERGDFLHADFR